MNRPSIKFVLMVLLSQLAGPPVGAAADTVATAVYARVGNGYKRERQADGSCQPEYYGLANGGRIAGTGSDVTVDRVTYPEVATIAARLLARQNYHYAQTAEQAKLMIVLHWGTTIAFNSGNYALSVDNASSAMSNLKALGGGPGGSPGQSGAGFGTNEGAAIQAAEEVFEGEMMKVLMENRARDQINLPNAKLLGYLDEINDADGIQRYAGGGDRYNDLIADIEESRYYIVISAYDFEQLVKHEKKKLLWQTKVSVRAPGNRFDDSIMAMMKSASKFFGQNSDRLIRGEETKGTVEFGDLKFLGEALETAPTKTEQPKPESK